MKPESPTSIENERNLATKIYEYWMERGFAGIKPEIRRVEELTLTGGKVTYSAVRSNIGPNGYPPRE